MNERSQKWIERVRSEWGKSEVNWRSQKWMKKSEVNERSQKWMRRVRSESEISVFAKSLSVANEQSIQLDRRSLHTITDYTFKTSFRILLDHLRELSSRTSFERKARKFSNVIHKHSLIESLRKLLAWNADFVNCWSATSMLLSWLTLARLKRVQDSLFEMLFCSDAR